jgi:hypothetical protein
MYLMQKERQMNFNFFEGSSNMKSVLVMMAIVCGLVGVVQAVEVTADVTYTTKYMWRGFNVFESSGAVQPSIDMALDNGLSFNVWASYATGGGYGEEGTEYNYTVAYSNSVNEGCPTKTDYTFGYRYYDFIDMPSNAADMQEVFLEMEMPELVGGGIIPHMAWYQMWEGRDGRNGFSKNGGSIFVLGFNYGFSMEQAPELPINFSWDIVYNGGTGVVPAGNTVDHDWSHMVWGLSTAMTCPMTGATVTPAVYYQNSFEDTVNTSDELWASLSYSMGF